MASGNDRRGGGGRGRGGGPPSGGQSRGGQSRGGQSRGGHGDPGAHGSQQRGVVDRVAEKLSAHAEKQERLAAKAAKAAEKLDHLTSQLGAIELWLRHEGPTRKPRFSRDDIAAAAMRIADTEGFDAVSMRRIAVELDAGTMTLYHYVRTKDELLALLNDAVMGEVVVPGDDPIPADWREALSVIAHRTRDAFERHPWIMDITDEPPLGPNSVRHFDQTLQAVQHLPVSLQEQFDIVMIVDAYVFGYCMQHRDDADGTNEIPPEMRDYVENLVRTGAYPRLSELANDLGFDEAWRQLSTHGTDPTRFERGLQWVLDGIAANLPQQP
jgi:AcrR family transcriptional regulator